MQPLCTVQDSLNKTKVPWKLEDPVTLERDHHLKSVVNFVEL